MDAAEKAAKRAEAEVARLRGMVNRTHELLEQGVYDTDTFLERSRSLYAQVSAAEAALLRSREAVDAEKRREIHTRNIVPKVERLLDVYWTLPSAQAKNDLLREVLDKVVYYREKKSKKGGPYDEFELTLFPRLPKGE